MNNKKKCKHVIIFGTMKEEIKKIKEMQKAKRIKLMDALDLIDEMADEAVQGNIELQVKKGLAYNLIMEFIHSK